MYVDVFDSKNVFPMFSKPMDHEDPLTQDLECIVCLSLPDQDQDCLHVFSCQQHHLLCRTCLTPQIRSCPLCRQDFHKMKPQRNYLAERLISQQIKYSKKSAQEEKMVNPASTSIMIGNHFLIEFILNFDSHFLKSLV